MGVRLVAQLRLDPVRMIKLLRKVAFWEATFFVVLCVAWVVSLTGYKLTGPWHSALVVVGFSHGCVFTAYLFLVLLVRSRMRWSVVHHPQHPGGGAHTGRRVRGRNEGPERSPGRPGRRALTAWPTCSDRLADVL